MATWTALTFAFGSLLTSTKMTQLYDNITALAEGAANAPSLQNSAYGYGSITPDKHTVTAAGSYTYAAPASGGASTTEAVYTKVKEFMVARPGAYRMLGNATITGGTGYLKICRNGSATSPSVGSEYTVSVGAPVTLTENISSWTPGDRLQAYLKSNGSDTLTLANFRIGVSSASMFEMFELIV